MVTQAYRASRGSGGADYDIYTVSAGGVGAGNDIRIVRTGGAGTINTLTQLEAEMLAGYDIRHK